MVTVVRQCVGDSERGIRGREGGGHCSLENLTSWPSASKRERERERGGGGGGGEERKETYCSLERLTSWPSARLHRALISCADTL